jgi:hypothetical protein
MITRHVVILNPALSVRGERYEVVEGKTYSRYSTSRKIERDTERFGLTGQTIGASERASCFP